MKLNKENFDYLLTSKIVVLGDYKNEAYFACVKKQNDVIEFAWEKEQEGRNKKLINGNILNLAKIEKQGNALILLCHPVEYKHYIAQRSGIDLGITPLAVSGIVFYQENDTKIFYLGKRSESVTQYPRFYEFIPSGSIDVNDIEPNKPIDYSRQLIIELKEELGILFENVKEQKTFCLLFDEVDNVYDIGVEIEVSNSQIKIDETEYFSSQKLSLNSVTEYMKGNNIVNTSRKLFKAWSSFRSGDVK